MRINHVHVLTNQYFKDNTKILIAESQDDPKVKAELTYWDCNDIATQVVKLPSVRDLLFITEDVIKYTYDAHIRSVLSDDTSIRLFAREFDTKFTSLEEIQIDVQAQSREHESERDNYLKPLSTKVKSIPVRFFPKIDEIMGTAKNFLVHGIATSGKTTILRKLGKDFMVHFPEGLVFYLELSKFGAAIQKDGLTAVCKTQYSKMTHVDLAWDKVLAESKVLVLLDGIDEVHDHTIQDSIIDGIDSSRTEKNLKIVCSARTSDWLLGNGRLKTILEYYELLPLTLSEMMKIGGKFLKDDKQYRDFTKIIRRSQIAQAFPKTPLTTILLAILMKEEKLNTQDLPKNVTELYSKITDIFLNKWDKEKGVSEQYQHQVRLFILQKLAWHMHQDGKLAIDEFELTQFLNELSTKHPLESVGDPKSFIDSICQRSNLIIRNESDGTYSFFHPTIQEYLLSSIINQVDEGRLVETFYDNWWLNANIFYAGRTPFRSGVLDRISSLKENYPVDIDSKLAYVIHCSKVLQAAHLIDKEQRLLIVKSILSVFDKMIVESLEEIPIEKDRRLKRRTMLDWILHFRRIFVEFLGSQQFLQSLGQVHSEIFSNAEAAYSDVLEYSLSYVLSVKNRDSKFLEACTKMRQKCNPRWFQIIAVDLDLLDLKPTDAKYLGQLRAKVKRNKDYIHEQFSDRMEKHYMSITGVR